MCEANFAESLKLINHIEITHGVPSIYKYKCKQPRCKQTFQNKYTFKKHLHKHEKDFSLEREELISSDQIHPVHISGHNNSRSTLKLSEVKECAKQNHKINDVNFENLKDSFLRFLLNLHSQNNFSRKDIISIQNNIKTYIFEPLFEVFTNLSNNSEFKPENKSLFEKMKNILKETFSCGNTEYKFLSHIQNLNIYRPPKCFIISCELSEIIVRNTPIIDKNKVEGCLVDISFQIKKYFESPGILPKTLENMKNLQKKGKLRNIINGKMWKKKKFKENDIVIPYFLYFDDFEINDPLGSNSGRYSVCGIYYSFPTIPEHHLSKLNNIFVAGFIKSCDINEFGYERSLNPLVTKLKELEENGLTIETDEKKMKIFFVLGQIVGDNLGLNSVLGFVKSFNSNSFCRICKRNKIETQTDTTESALRTKENYENDLDFVDFRFTGIKENSSFNNLHYFHVTDNMACDIMHDLFSGVCKYDLSKILNYFIYERKMFSLETLNSRKQMFPYGETEIQNASVSIEKHHIQNGTFKMNAKEMKTFIHFILLMIGDFVEENNEVYNFLKILIKMIDLLLLSEFDRDVLDELREVIQKHNFLYQSLFKDTLKPKHHFLNHYPTIIENIGSIKRFWCFRFEAFHHLHKTYARNITSRVNIPLSLCIKSSLRFSNLLISNDFFKKDVELFDNCMKTDIKSENYFPFIKLNELKQVSNLEKAQKIKFKGTTFKTGYFITRSERINAMPLLLEIKDIIISDESGCFAVCKEWEVDNFSEHLLSYICKEKESPSYHIVNLNKIDGPPIHIYFLPNGEKVIRLKKYY